MQGEADRPRFVADGGLRMGITFLKVKVSNPARPKKSSIHEFLVDSGAVYSVMPEEVLKRLGIKPTSEEEFILANGETIRNRIGNALFELHGKLRAAPVIFGEKGIFLLGATTLEALGMILDPIRRELKPLPMVLMASPVAVVRNKQ
jgi:predicted aspartyl protease